MAFESFARDQPFASGPALAPDRRLAPGAEHRDDDTRAGKVSQPPVLGFAAAGPAVIEPVDHRGAPSTETRPPSPSPSPLSRRRFLIGAAVVAGGGGAVAALSRLSAPALPSLLRLATGPKGAVFVEVGGDIANAVHGYAPQTAVDVRVTSATVENLRLLATGSCDLGFASLDAAALDAQVRTREITALGRIYDSCLHLVVPTRSPVRSVRDLTGLRVGVGAASSGTEFTAVRLLEATGVQPAQVLRLGQTPAMQGLFNGSLDAAFSLTGFPTPAIADLARRFPIRLVPVGEYFGLLDRSIPRSYAPSPIPAGIYQGVGETDSVLVPNVLLARPGLSDVAAGLMMNAIYGKDSRRYWVHPDSQRISREMAIITGSIVLHPAARSWLDSH